MGHALTHAAIRAREKKKEHMGVERHGVERHGMEGWRGVGWRGTSQTQQQRQHRRISHALELIIHLQINNSRHADA